MPEKPYISQGANTGDDLYAMGAFPIGIGTFNPTDIINPGDTGLFAGFEPVMEAISTPNPGGVLLEAKTVSGAAPLMISDAAKNQIWSLLTNIKPVQDLHGYSNPWPAGAGVNKIDNDALQAGNYNKYGIPNFLKNNTTYTYSVYGTPGYSYRLMLGHTYESTPQPNVPVSASYLSVGSKETFTTGNDVESWEYIFFAGSAPGSGSADVLFQVQVGSVPTPTYSPYSNICPIQGWTGCNVYISPTTNAADAIVYPCVWQDEAGTVYGGQIDVATGWLEVTHQLFAIKDMDYSPSNPASHIYRTDSLKTIIVSQLTSGDMPNGISDAYKGLAYGPISVNNNGCFSIADQASSAVGRVVFIDHRYSTISDFVAGNADTHILCELKTHIYYQVPATNIFTLDGVNYIWSDCGDQITVQYAAVK